MIQATCIHLFFEGIWKTRKILFSILHFFFGIDNKSHMEIKQRKLQCYAMYNDIYITMLMQCYQNTTKVLKTRTNFMKK